MHAGTRGIRGSQILAPYGKGRAFAKDKSLSCDYLTGLEAAIGAGMPALILDL